MGAACVVKQSDPWNIHPGGQEACQLGVAVLQATGSWAEALALQVNLLTWWLWLAAGGRGLTEEI